MVDLHLHLLPAIDDGPRDIAASLEMARALIDDGVRQVAVSPHVNESHPNSASEILDALAGLREELERVGIDLPVASGAEIALERMPALDDDELVALSVGGLGRHLLVEPPRFAWPMDIELHVGRAASLGMQVILAHPECCAALQEDASPLARLVERGVLGQVSASSLVGDAGHTVMRAAQAMIDRGLIQIISSDAHGADRRPPRMSAAFELLGSGDLAQWMTSAAPAAVLAGESPPAAPAEQRPRRRGLLRRGR